MEDVLEPPEASQPGIHNDMLVCLECGALHETGTDMLRRFEDLRGEYAGTLEQLEAAKTRMVQQEATIRRIKSEGNQQQSHNPEYENAVAVLEYWKSECSPKARETRSGKRIDLVIARLKGGYSVEQLMECVDGYAMFPYWVKFAHRRTGTPVQRKIEPEYVFRDADHVLKGIQLAEQARYEAARAAAVGDKDPSTEVPLAQPEVQKPIHIDETIDLGSIGNSALRYVQRGWFVFPCSTNSKKPPRNSNGLLGAKNSPQDVIRYWSQRATANVAIRTGSQTGIVVLDVDDGRDGYETLRKLEAKYEPLPSTRSVKTPRGGNHYYFLHPGEEIHNTNDVPGPGIDIRGDGGYVLAPPSEIDGRLYEVDEDVEIAPMPDWLVEGLRRYRTQRRKNIGTKAWDQIVQKGVSEGARNAQLTSLAGVYVNDINRGVHDADFYLGQLHAINEARCSPPLPPEDVDRIFHSIMATDARNRAKEAAAE